MKLNLYLAVGGASDLFNDSKAVSESIAEGWTPLWLSTISPDSGIYAALCRVGILFAVGALMVWSLHFIATYHRTGVFDIEATLWPLVVVVFLGFDGALLSQITIFMRDVINYANQTFLENASAAYSLQEAYQEAMYHGVATTQIGALLRQCQALTGQQQLDCLKQASAQAKEIVDLYGLESNTFIELLERMGTAVNQSNNPLESLHAPFNALIGAANQAIARVILVSFQSAFQQTLEGTLLLTSLLGPLAMGGSILPMASRSCVAWATGFISVGMAKLCYNIMVGFAAVVVTRAQAADNMSFLLTAAILAPSVSLLLAAGGGMAVWGALTQLQVEAADMASSAISLIVFKKLL